MHLRSKKTSEIYSKIGGLDGKKSKTVSKCPLCRFFFQKTPTIIQLSKHVKKYDIHVI